MNSVCGTIKQLKRTGFLVCWDQTVGMKGNSTQSQVFVAIFMFIPGMFVF